MKTFLKTFPKMPKTGQNGQNSGIFGVIRLFFLVLGCISIGNCGLEIGFAFDFFCLKTFWKPPKSGFLGCFCAFCPVLGLFWQCFTWNISLFRRLYMFLFHVEHFALHRSFCNCFTWNIWVFVHENKFAWTTRRILAKPLNPLKSGCLGSFWAILGYCMGF